jgi:hypothetical protein
VYKIIYLPDSCKEILQFKEYWIPINPYTTLDKAYNVLNDNTFFITLDVKNLLFIENKNDPINTNYRNKVKRLPNYLFEIIEV